MSNVAEQQDYGAELSITLKAKKDIVLNIGNVVEFYFIEDIYSYMISGKLIFTDINAIWEENQFTSGVDIEVTYGVKEDITLSFNIYSIQRIIPTDANDPTTNLIELLFCDFGFHQLTSQKYSKSWTNMKASDIVQHIWKHMIDPKDIEIGEIEDTKGMIDFTSPWWSSAQMIQWLSFRSRSAKHGDDGGWGYVNFTKIDPSSKKKKWNYVTMETLLCESMDTKLDEGIYSFESSELYRWNRILNHNISGIDSFNLKQLRGGTSYGYDFKDKNKIIEKVFKYEETAPKFSILGNQTLMKGKEDKVTDENMNFYLTADDSVELLENQYYHDWIKRYCIQNTVSIEVRGHENRQIGKLVKIKWPSVNESSWNENMDGRYLVKSITHFFSPKGSPNFRQKLVLMKNGYNYQDTSMFLKSVKNKNA